MFLFGEECGRNGFAARAGAGCTDNKSYGWERIKWELRYFFGRVACEVSHHRRLSTSGDRMRHEDGCASSPRVVHDNNTKEIQLDEIVV